MKRKILRIIGISFFIFLIYMINAKAINAYSFERELKDSTGWSTIDLNIKKDANENSNTIGTLPKGKAFSILSESGNYWQINYNNISGYVKHDYCMINLPDIEPSIVYNITNAGLSIYKSSGIEISEVTGKKLYTTGKIMNSKIR